jgi:hypothetical protein
LEAELIRGPEVIFLNDVTVRSASRLSRYIGPYVVATELEAHGIETVVIDWFTDIPDFFAYLSQFITPNLKVIGLSSTFLTQKMTSSGKPPRSEVGKSSMASFLWFSDEQELTDWLGRLKTALHKANPNAILVLGGARVPFIYKYHSKLQHSPFRFFDYLYSGNSASALIDWILACRNGESRKPSDAFAVMKSAETVGCPQTDFHRRHAIAPREGLPLEVSRGCAFSCKFCYYEKRTSNVKPIESLKQELIRNYELFGTQAYHFCDDCFNDNRRKVEEVCNAILGLSFKIEWVSYARPDMSVRFPFMMELMIESGCRGIWWGIETFNHKAGLSAGKGLDPEIIIANLKDWRFKYKSDCLFQASFITGLPGETEDSQNRTIGLVVENDLFDFVSVGTLGVVEFDELLDNEMFTIDFSEYSRNPRKYGFEVISFHPHYWKHSSMDSTAADRLAQDFMRRWQLSRGNPLMTSIWSYPILKGFDFTKDEIFSMAREPSRRDSWSVDVAQRRSRWMEQYWSRLEQVWTK